MLDCMATNKLPDTVYKFICAHVAETGNFPKTYEIARGCNMQDSTAETVLKLLETRRLIERLGQKRGDRLADRGDDRHA